MGDSKNARNACLREPLRILGFMATIYLSSFRESLGGCGVCVCSLNFSKTVGYGEKRFLFGVPLRIHRTRATVYLPNVRAMLWDAGMRSRYFAQVSIGDMADDGDAHFGYH